MAKNTFVLDKKYYAQIKLLDQKQKADLLTAIFEHEILGDTELKLDAATQMLYSIIAQDLDINAEKYEEKCKKQQEYREDRKTEKTEKTKKIKKEKKEEKNKKTNVVYDNEYDTDTDTDNEYDTDNITKDNDIYQKGVIGGEEKSPTPSKTIQIIPPTPSRSNRFVPPNIEEVQIYCKKRKNNVNAQQFIDFYTAKGWKIGKNPMKDWKACVRTWERNRIDSNNATKLPTAFKPENDEFSNLERFYDNIPPDGGVL